VPVAQAVQVLTPVYPALHRHARSEKLPAGEMEFGVHAVQVAKLVCPVNAEYLPAEQSVHATEPAIVLYVPGAQALHVEVPVYPASHWHAELEELPAGELKFGGHAVQVVELVCPLDAEYVPAGQAVHAAEPAIVLYVPAAQASHVEVPV